MVNMFKDINTRLERYGKIYYHPKTQIQINRFFELLGVQKLCCSNSHNTATFEEELTLHLGCYFSDHIYESNRDTREFYNNILPIGHYFYQFEDCIDLIHPEKEEVILATYRKLNNILIIPINILQLCKYPKKISYILEHIGKSILKQKIRFETVDVSESKKKYVLKNLKGNLSKKVNRCKQNILDDESTIFNYRKALKERYDKLIIERANLETYKKLDESFDTEILITLKEIEKLPFVKTVEITESGIVVDIGKITFEGMIKVDEEVRKQKTKFYLGDFTITFTGEEVKFFNKDSLRVGGNDYYHMHSHSGNTCFDQYENLYAKLMSEYKYKQLTVMGYSFLKNYNANSPLMSIERFYKLRKEQGKFDVEGNLIQKKLKEEN